MYSQGYGISHLYERDLTSCGRYVFSRNKAGGGMKENHFSGLMAFISTAIWIIVMWLCAVALKDEVCMPQVQKILGAAAMANIILIWGPVGFRAAKRTKRGDRNNFYLKLELLFREEQPEG